MKKNNLKKLKYQKGSSTLEILIAFAVLIISITAVILVVFGNQSSAVDTETNSEALYKAESILEGARADSRGDFLSVITASSSEMSGPLLYQKDLFVSDLTQCKKQATSTVTWATTTPRTQKIELTTFFTDIAGMFALGGDCAVDPPNSDDWRMPRDSNFTGHSLMTEGTGKAIDAQNNKAFLVTKAGGNNKDDFYIFDTTNIANPVKRGHLDISDGLEDIDVAGNFAFIANDENKAMEQLVVVDVATNVDAPEIVATSTLIGVSGTCPLTCPGGRSIYYYKDYVYLGTHRLAVGGAAEFHVFNVTDPTDPSPSGSKGGTMGDPVDHNINDIFVREQNINGTIRTYAYLATSNNSGELTILNVTDPSNIPDPTGSPGTGKVFNLPGANNAGEELDATSLSIIGNRAYIGRERAANLNNKDFYIVDISNPGDPLIIGSINLGLNSNGANAVGVAGIQVVSNLAMIATTDPNNPFIVLDISNPDSIIPWILSGCEINFSTYPTGIDYDNNLIYFSLHNGNSNINLEIIKPTGGSGATCPS